MAALQGLAHHLDVTDALKTVVGAAAGEFDQMRYQVALHLGRVNKVRHAELSAEGFALRVEIHPDDFVCACQPGALYHIEPDTAKPKDNHVGTGLDLGRIDDRTDTGGYAAADVADLIERCILTDLGKCDLRHDGVV